MDALLIFEMDINIYECILVNKDRLPEARETAKLAYNEWVTGWWDGNVFEFMFKALDKAGIPYRRIKDWERLKF